MKLLGCIKGGKFLEYVRLLSTAEGLCSSEVVFYLQTVERRAGKTNRIPYPYHNDSSNRLENAPSLIRRFSIKIIDIEVAITI
jgi:hypothetical protein